MYLPKELKAIYNNITHAIKSDKKTLIKKSLADAFLCGIASAQGAAGAGGLEDYYQKVMRSIEEVTGVTESDIKGGRKYRNIADARACAFFYLYPRYATIPTIARKLNKNPSTVTLGIQRYKQLMIVDAAFRSNSINILQLINNTTL